MAVGKTVVDEKMKIRMKAMCQKGLTNKQMSVELGIKEATVAYWTPRFRDSKKVIPLAVSGVNEAVLTETYFGEEITGFFEHEGTLYCVMESGIALGMKDTVIVSKNEVDNIKEKIKREYELIKKRMELFGGTK